MLRPETHFGRMRRAAAAAALIAIAAMLAGCDDYVRNAGSVKISAVGYSADRETFTVRIDEATLGDGEYSARIKLIQRGDRTIFLNSSVVGGADLTLSSDRESVSGTFTIPASEIGATNLDVSIRVQSETLPIECLAGYCDTITYYAWSNTVRIPPVPPAPTPTAAPTAKVFARNVPTGEAPAVLDARLSTGTGALTYAWTPACNGSADEGFGEPLPAGVMRVPRSYPGGTCTVTVTDTATGLTSTASIDVAEQSTTLVDGQIAIADGSATLTGPRLGAVAPGVACVNVDGAAPLNEKVALVATGGGTVGTIPVTRTAGLHRITAAFWGEGANDECANTSLTGTGLIQVVSALYDGASGAVRRAGATYAAPSTLRLASGTIVRQGKLDRLGARSGAITRGKFGWKMPKTAGGTPRPSALAALAFGTYASRVEKLVFGPGKGQNVALIGTTTVLLRGRTGALACVRIDGEPDATTVTLLGGAGALARQSATVTAGATKYQLPSTSAGWKSATVRPTSIAGVLTASARTAPSKLPRACAALKRYLP